MLDAPPTVDALEDNRPRVAPGQPGVESWFLRANHPDRPLALWIKATSIVPRRGRPRVESWFIAFDGERGATWAARESHAWPEPSEDWCVERLVAGPLHMAVDPGAGEIISVRVFGAVKLKRTSSVE